MHRILVCSVLAIAALFALTSATPACSGHHAATAPVPGGAPYITIGGKASGTITRKEWGAVTAVEIKGCVARPVVSASTVHFTDGKGKPVTATVEGAKLTAEQKDLVAKLPANTRFTLRVEAFEGKLKLDVREAVFTLVE